MMYNVVRVTRFNKAVISKHDSLDDANLKLMNISQEFNFSMKDTTKELIDGRLVITKTDTLTLFVEKEMLDN